MSATITGPPAPPRAPAGQLVIAKRYRVLRTLGRGGMGSVVEVLDQKTDRLRALKLMRAELAADATLRARFELEAMVAGRVESEHVIEVLDAGIDEDTGSPYLVMELLRGEDLGALLHRTGPLSPERALVYLGQVAMGLERTHADNIVHRDLKPENLFLAQRDDGSPRIKILDFGVAKVIAATAAQSTRSLGTPLYMAPEQLTGDGSIDARADLYALGQVAFALLTGFAYFTVEHERADNLFALATQMARGPLEPATARARKSSIELPAAFDSWFERATAPAIASRFESAVDEVQALAGVLGLPSPFPTALPIAAGGRTSMAEPLDAAATVPESPSALTPTVAAGPLELAPLQATRAAMATSSTGVAVPSTSHPSISAPARGSRKTWLVAAAAVALAGASVFAVSGPRAELGVGTGSAPSLAPRTTSPSPLPSVVPSDTRGGPSDTRGGPDVSPAEPPTSGHPSSAASSRAGPSSAPSTDKPSAAKTATSSSAPRSASRKDPPGSPTGSAPAASTHAQPGPTARPATTYDPLRDF